MCIYNYVYMLYTHIRIYIYVYIYMCVCRGMACLITGTIYLMVFQESSISPPQPQFSQSNITQFRSGLLVLDLPKALTHMASPYVSVFRVAPRLGLWALALCTFSWTVFKPMAKTLMLSGPVTMSSMETFPCAPFQSVPEQRRGPVVAKTGQKHGTEMIPVKITLELLDSHAHTYLYINIYICICIYMFINIDYYINLLGVNSQDNDPNEVDIEMDRQIGRSIHRQQAGRSIDRQIDGQIDWQMDRQTGIWMDQIR